MRAGQFLLKRPEDFGFDRLERKIDLIAGAASALDSIVPFAMGEQLFQAANAPKKFIRVEGAGHHNLSGVALAEYRQALRELFKIPG